MKFDVVTGNPPYQENLENTSDAAVYNYFYELAEKISPVYCLISPARFLFNAGNTDKNWNQKMLSDKHIKVEYYEQNSSKVFANTDIKGGIAVLYRNKNKEFGKIENDIDTLRMIIESIEGVPTSPTSKLAFLKTRINNLIQANSKTFLATITDPLLSTKVLIMPSLTKLSNIL